MTTNASAAAIEIAGRNWLTAQLLVRGFEVAIPTIDRGVDVIVFKETGNHGIRALPLQLKCSANESSNLDRKYEGRGIPLAYIWNSLSSPTVLFLTYEEALAVLGNQAASTASWQRQGRYAVTRVGGELRSKLSTYAHRWEWLSAKLEGQPASGE